MGFLRKLVIPVVTDSGGAATVYSDPFSGKIVSINYIKTDFANGSTITTTVESTGEAVWTESNVNASATRYPRAATHSILGAAALYAAAGTGVFDQIGLANDRLKFVIASGGATKSGAFHVTVE